MKKLLLFFIVLLCSTNFVYGQAEISARLQRVIVNSAENDYIKAIVYLRDQVNLVALDNSLYTEKASMNKRVYDVITALQNKAESSQSSILEFVQSKYATSDVFTFKSLWIVNSIIIEAKKNVITDLALRMDVSSIDYDAETFLEPYTVEPNNTSENTEAVEPGLKIINAPLLWAMGITGQGRLVMGEDTGVFHTHPAINYKWRGNSGPAAHAWIDPGAGSLTPSDCDGHGTHTVGTMVGLAPATGDTIGVAIGAEWIAAKTICTGNSTSNHMVAYQWAMNPDGNAATITDVPDAINNSWFDPNTVNQCSGDYKLMFDALEAAGIAVVFSAGNGGPGTSTITMPKNINTNIVNVFSVANIVGSTYLAGSNDPISSSSSRGPSTCGGTGSLLIKPEVSAPGTSVRSSGTATGYTSLTGTSMAAPHVAGSVALLKQAYPGLTGKQILTALYNTAKDLGAVGEDNNYGMGLINVYAAYQSLSSLLYPLNPFNINTPAAGVTVTSFPNSSSNQMITWDTASAGATYKWFFGTNSNPRMISVNSTTNSLSLNMGVLDNLLAGIGVLPGDSIVGQWDVWAYRNNSPAFDTLKSTNGPRPITLKRGKPVLSAFNLSSPVAGTTITTSTFNTSTLTFNWTRSGVGTKYNWKFGTVVEKGESTVILQNLSNGGGFDSLFTITSAALDLRLASAGIQPGSSVTGVWSVYAVSGNDSLKAAQSWAITLMRQAKGDVILVYDSTSINGRISRDSITTYLASKNITFDLFNKGTSTTTAASVSFRGYNKVIWSGEGLNVMSLPQKDSLKAYLDNPIAGQRSKLVLFAEDIGYQLGRTGSSYIDLPFLNNYLGANYVLDRPTSGAAQRLVADHSLIPGTSDSTIGTYPDVLSRFVVPTTHALYRFAVDNSINAIGKVGATWNSTIFGVDVESLRRSFLSPSGSPHARMLDLGILYVDTDGQIPVELVSFNASVVNNFVSLTWKTASEINNKGFEVQRKSGVGEYQVLAFVEGKGTSVETQVYSFSDKVTASGKYTYRLRQVDFDGTFDFSGAIELDVIAPVEFHLGQNYPNPFNPSTKISFGLAIDSKVSLEIYDILGQKVMTLINKDMALGVHQVEFNASKLNSGVYFYSIEAKGADGSRFTSVKKMLLMK